MAAGACLLASAAPARQAEQPTRTDPPASQPGNETPDQAGVQDQPQAVPLDPVDRAVAMLRAGQAGADAEIARLLREPSVAQRLLTALADLERLPPAIWRPLSTLTTAEHPAELRVQATRLLPRFGSRDAAIRLLALIEEPAVPVAQAARQSLRELTGFGEGWSDEQWRAWAAGAADWSDRAWNSVILARQAARARIQAERQRTMSDELVALYRRLHVELEAAGRTTLLAELIGDDRPSLRDLGFELAGRDLSARTQLGPEVAAAAAARLTHPDPGTRARAATLVSRLVPPDAMLTLTRALQTESVPQAAEPMLLGVARWPNEEAVLPTIRWLERDDAPFGAVTTALWAFAQTDLLAEPALRDRVLANLRRRDPARGGEAALKLLVRLGDETDLARVAALLASPDDPVRNAAASALAETPAGADLLLHAAASDPRLFPQARRAIGAHFVSPLGLRRLAALPAIDPVARDQALIELGSRLPSAQLAAAVTDAGLPPAISEPILARLNGSEAERTPEILTGLLLLAETRLELQRPVDALAVVTQIDPAVLGESQARQWSRLRTVATIMSGDLDNQDRLANADLEQWMEAWERLGETSSLRAAVAARIGDRFADRLTPEQVARLGLRNGETESETAEPPATVPDET